MNTRPNIRPAIVINCALILLACLVLNSFLNYQNYTIEKNGNWESTKTRLTGVNGVYAYMLTKTPLFKNRLNIAAWHGYQELIYNKPIALSGLHFKYSSGYFPFALILHQSDLLTYGIYFHYKKDSTCCLFLADREGKFLSKQNFYIHTDPKKPEWNRVEIKRSADSVFMLMNNQICQRSLFKIPDTVKFGFRGGAFPVFIDDVVAYNIRGEKVMEDDFADPFSLKPLAVIFALLLLAILLCFYKTSYRGLLTAFNMSILLGFIACYLLYFFYLSGLYPNNGDYFRWHGKIVGFEFEDMVCARIQKQYGEGKKKPVILFIGSSQTWGAGTSSPQHAYPALIEKNLRSYFHDSTITAVNAAICGNKAEWLYGFYTKEWYKLQPLLTVIDLSHNDSDPIIFRKYIRKFLEYNGLRNIKTILIAEPDDYAYTSTLQENHRVMQEEGDRFKVPIIAMQQYMDSSYEKGFLWWDLVHMTDYGYRLFSERVTPCIINELERDSLLFKLNY